MRFIEQFVTLETAADILFDLLPDEILEKHKKTITKKKFIDECRENTFFYTKFLKEEEVKRMILYLLSEWKQSNKELSPDIFTYLFL